MTHLLTFTGAAVLIYMALCMAQDTIQAERAADEARTQALVESITP